MRKSSDFKSQSELRDTSLHLLCLHSRMRATHWIICDFLSGLSFCSMLFSVCFSWFALTVHSAVSWAGLLHGSRWSESHLLFTPCWSEKEQMNVSKQTILSHRSLLTNPKKKKKRCKNVANVWLKVSLVGLHISDSFVYQRNTIALKKEEKFAVLYIKWCLFSILTLQVTSEGATSTGFCTYMINVNSSLLI